MTDDRPHTWRHHAACQDADPNLFFPTPTPGAHNSWRKATTPVARRYCQRCPTRDPCHRYAERTQALGLWAGVWRAYQRGEYKARPVLTQEPT